MCLGIPGRITSITDTEQMTGVVDVSGVRRAVDLTCVAIGPLDDLVGKWVLVHVGFAMSIIDEDEAQATLQALAELGEAEAELAAMRASAEMLEQCR